MMGTCLDEKRRPTPREEGVEVSDAVEAVFERALSLDPRKRPNDAGEFWDELLDALGMNEKGLSQRRIQTLESEPLEQPKREVETLIAPPESDKPPPPQAFDFELVAPGGSSLQPGWTPPSKPPRAPELMSVPSPPAARIELEPPQPRPSARLGLAREAPTTPIRPGSTTHPLAARSRLRLRQGVALVLGGTLIGIIDRGYEALTEQNLLPVPLVYVSGPLILLGVIAIIVGLLPAAG